jgi:hypothetical protein
LLRSTALVAGANRSPLRRAPLHASMHCQVHNALLLKKPGPLVVTVSCSVMLGDNEERFPLTAYARFTFYKSPVMIVS